MPMISLLIADDHNLFRKGLVQICDVLGGFNVVGEADNGRTVIELARQLRPDVILMDINMPVMNGVEATQKIIKAWPQARIIILTMYRQEDMIFQAIKAGARGYLLKDIDEQKLIDNVKTIHQGEALISPDIAVKIIEAFQRLSNPKDDNRENEQLTAGEMAVLRRIAQGEENRDIASKLNLSQRTVANRLSEIYQKLHVNNRTQAALIALRKGWANLYEEDC